MHRVDTLIVIHLNLQHLEHGLFLQLLLKREILGGRLSLFNLLVQKQTELIKIGIEPEAYSPNEGLSFFSEIIPFCLVRLVLHV